MMEQRHTDEIDIELVKSNRLLVFYLVLASISFLFIGLIFAYTYSIFISQVASYSLPWIFYFNTFILYIVSYLIFKTKYKGFSKKVDRSKIVLLLIFLFFIFQCIAWYQLFTQLESTGIQSGIYFLFLLSIVHSLHIIGGIPFHFRYLQQAIQYHRYSARNQELLQQRLEIIHRYWHFLDILWTLMMIIFIVQMFIN